MSRTLLIVMTSLGLGFSSLGCGSESEKHEGGAGGSAGTSSSPSGSQLTDARDGRVYGLKAFGDQVWMTENLAVGEPYNPKVSNVVVGDIQRWCPQTYPDPITPSPCDLYGGYYTWAQTMALPTTCNSTDCSAQIQAPHRGICPVGFHVPSKAEFEALASFVANQTGLVAKDDMGRYSQIGAALRTNSACETPGTEAPSVGFNGLPSGYANDTGYVTANGIWTFFQSTTQDPGYSYGWALACDDDLFFEGFYYKDHALPVRCLKD
jgi:uncharacterized protein (TIGR02145 family)